MSRSGRRPPSPADGRRAERRHRRGRRRGRRFGQACRERERESGPTAGSSRRAGAAFPSSPEKARKPDDSNGYRHHQGLVRGRRAALRDALSPGGTLDRVRPAATRHGGRRARRQHGAGPTGSTDSVRMTVQLAPATTSRRAGSVRETTDSPGRRAGHGWGRRRSRPGYGPDVASPPYGEPCHDHPQNRRNVPFSPLGAVDERI